MKKYLALLLVLAMMVCCLAACGSSKEDKSPEDVQTDGEAPNTSEEPDTSEAPITSEEPNTDSDNVGYVRGTVDGAKWSSKWIGLAFDGGSDYIMTTDEELQTLMQQASETFDWSNVDYSRLTNVYEMMAVTITGDNVIVMTEKLPLSNMTLDQYITDLKSQMEMMYGESLGSRETWCCIFC